jgi:hypothetical protein
MPSAEPWRPTTTEGSRQMVNDEGWRTPPLTCYQPTNVVLEAPLDAVEATLAMLRRAGARESGLFWYGQRGAQRSVVTSVRAPRQQMSVFNYRVSADAMREMGASLPDDLRPLAQIHSHPGEFIEHSPYDDEMASSRRALSLVFPCYGHLKSPLTQGVGVHEWQDDYWHLLTPAQALARVVIVPRASVEKIDFR